MRWSFGRLTFPLFFYTSFGFDGTTVTNRGEFQNLRGTSPSLRAHGVCMALGGLCFSAGASNIDNHVSSISATIYAFPTLLV